MRVYCQIRNGKIKIPQYWLEKWQEETGEKPDTVVFDLSDTNAKVPAGVFLATREPKFAREEETNGTTANR